VTLLWVWLAGAAGAVARFVVDGAVRHRWAPTFPWATLAINVSGSLLLGLVTGAVLFAGAADPWRAVVGTGLCGGYTTFSAASVETVRLAQQGRAAAALANAVGSLLASAAAAAVGLVVAAAIW
jgi:CrcB protein